jgi:hypothetical protein
VQRRTRKLWSWFSQPGRTRATVRFLSVRNNVSFVSARGSSRSALFQCLNGQKQSWALPTVLLRSIYTRKLSCSRREFVVYPSGVSLVPQVLNHEAMAARAILGGSTGMQTVAQFGRFLYSSNFKQSQGSSDQLLPL